jgi:hypothetical protein
MNEIEIIRQQLLLEGQHVSEVMAACASLGKANDTPERTLRHACLDYLTLASSRLEAPARSEVLAHLQPLRDAVAVTQADWHKLLQLLRLQWHGRVQAVNHLLDENPSVAEWRAIGQIDADSVLEERQRYAQVQAARAAAAPQPT